MTSSEAVMKKQRNNGLNIPDVDETLKRPSRLYDSNSSYAPISSIRRPCLLTQVRASNHLT